VGPRGRRPGDRHRRHDPEPGNQAPGLVRVVPPTGRRGQPGDDHRRDGDGRRHPGAQGGRPPHHPGEVGRVRRQPGVEQQDGEECHRQGQDDPAPGVEYRGVADRVPRGRPDRRQQVRRDQQAEEIPVGEALNPGEEAVVTAHR
jgi:hypothetical protein